MSVYCFSDLHGQLPLFEAIQNFLKEDDVCICLGDCCDRGKDGYTIIKQILTDKRFIFLKGNHEDLFSQAMKEYLGNDLSDGMGIQNLLNNGGHPTFSEWCDNGAVRGLDTLIDRLPTKYEYVNEDGQRIILSHAGFTPGDEEDLLWDRMHFYCAWPQDEEYENTIIIHGHTPIPNLIYELRKLRDIKGLSNEAFPGWDGGAYYYCGNHKIDIDCASFATGFITLLNLDTFDEHIFEIPDFKE